MCSSDLRDPFAHGGGEIGRERAARDARTELREGVEHGTRVAQPPDDDHGGIGVMAKLERDKEPDATERAGIHPRCIDLGEKGVAGDWSHCRRRLAVEGHC